MPDLRNPSNSAARPGWTRDRDDSFGTYYVGVIRQGSLVVWECPHTVDTSPHLFTADARRCAARELERQGV